MPSPRQTLLPKLRLERAKAAQRHAERSEKELRRQLDLAVDELQRRGRPKHVALPVQKPVRRLRGDVVRFCIPDTHGAKADKRALSAVLGDIKAIAPHEIILLGDHVDCGGFLAQHHTLGYVAETEYSYADDIDAAAAFLNRLQSLAPSARIDYIEGNHERRVETWCVTQTLRHRKDSEKLRRAFAPEFLLGLAERRIRYYRQGEFYDDLPVPGIIRRGKCYFTHGFTTAKHAVSTAQSRTAGNLVFGHTHRSQSELSRRLGVGIVGAWNPGCLCELQPLWNHTSPTEWTHGYAVQLVSRTNRFLHLNVPVIDGVSLLTALFKQ